MKIQYSEKALKNMSSSENKYELTGVKTHWIFLLLTGISILIIAFIVWGFCGSISESVKGNGIFLLKGGVSKIVSFGNGRVEKLNFKVGDEIKNGDILGYVSNPEINLNYSKVESDYKEMKTEVETLKKGSDELYSSMKKLFDERKLEYSSMKQKMEISRANAEEISEILKDLMHGKGVSKIEYYKTLDQLISTEIDVKNLMIQLMDLEQHLKIQEWEKEQKIITLNEQLNNKKAELETARKIKEEMSTIRAQHDGVLVELFKNENDYVRTGEVVGLIADNSQGNYLAGYLSPEDGKKVKKGMTAYFSPVTAPASKYGYIKCVVKDVGSAPINLEAVTAELSNESLAIALTGQRSVIRVELEPLLDENTQSGYAWTSGSGYPGPIFNGVPGTVVIDFDENSPASFVIPGIKEFYTENVNLYKPDNREQR